jgi:recombination protein RecA
MVSSELLAKLKNTKLLADEEDTMGYVSTGCFPLNYIIAGRYDGGVPIGGITQIRGDSSTGKTLFVTSILTEAIKKGYYAKLVDAENSFSKSFAQRIGIDPDKLLYSTADCIEDAFQDITDTIKQIREEDKETPIVIALDSIAVLPSRKELDATSYDKSPIEGAQRAMLIGGSLRKINPLLKANKVALVIINQIRHKVGVIYGSPETLAAGGHALEYYLKVDLKTKRTEKLMDGEKPLGIRGEIICSKNKESIPYRSCEFELLFDKGLSPYYGLVDSLADQGLITKSPNGRCQLGETKFTKSEFGELLLNKNNKDFDKLRKLFGLE